MVKWALNVRKLLEKKKSLSDKCTATEAIHTLNLFMYCSYFTLYKYITFKLFFIRAATIFQLIQK